jgi:hypothetical protein
MRGISGYVLIGGIAAFATCSVMLAGLGFAVNAGTLSLAGAVQVVDRSQKSDRLQIPAQISDQPGATQKPTRIGREPVPNGRQTAPAGCDTVFSPLSAAPTNPTGRCIS